MAKRARWLSAILLCCSCATARPSPEPLFEADRAFAVEARLHGLQAAFTRFAAEDAWVLKSGGAVRGRAEVEKAFEGTASVELEWEPRGGELSASGDVGFTWGTWRRRLKGDATGKTSSGRYLTAWRKTADGYKWTADLGDEDSPPAK